MSARPSSSSPRGAERSYGYSVGYRTLEISALTFGALLMVYTAHKALGGYAPSTSFGLFVGFLFFGLCLADLVSGVVHWLADTYGSTKTPIFHEFVRTFREHHTDPLAITRHDAIETNGDVFIFSSPGHALLLCFASSAYSHATVFGLMFGSYLNSQLHKWAHVAKPPAVVRLLQRRGLVLSPTHHAKHHSGDHTTNYCITFGWMNAVLDRTRFFRGLEWVFARLGIPRSR